MLFVMRLTQGDCVIASACDERSARDIASHLAAQDEEIVVSIRELDRFGVRFSPNDQGSLEVHCWDDATLDNVLANEYPVLNEAFRRANAAPLVPANHAPADHAAKPLMTTLKEAYEKNTEVIRQGLRLERQRFSSERALKTQKVAR
jgi:hypothetical protein